MGSLLVVDGSGVCRAPIVAYTLGVELAGAPLLAGDIEVRGITAETGSTMCESAAARIGYTGPAIAYFGSYRSIRLSVADLVGADLVLVAEREHRSAVVRMLPGIQASVFTWKEAQALARLAAERRRFGASAPPADLAGVARALHGLRGSVPLAEPAVRTGPFHWRRAADPLSTTSGHAPAADHRRVTEESRSTALTLASDLLAIVGDVGAGPVSEPGRGRRLRRPA